MDVIAVFRTFFEEQEHAWVRSASLVPQDTSVLFTTAGMQQFKPYYSGEPSPYGNRVVSVQKCFRADDLAEVGDSNHLTFFEMLGNFSFQYPDGENSYFKEQAIRMGYEFVAERLGLAIEYVTIFEGDEHTPRDTESERIWNELAAEKDITLPVYGENRDENFWGPTGSEGPCGPTSEIYVDGVEIWNLVFNQYYQHQDGTLEHQSNQGVDTGGGYERILAVLEQTESVFQTSVFAQVMAYIQDMFPDLALEHQRIIADHLRSALFLSADGVTPSNKEQGYVLRRLIRKVLSLAGMQKESLPGLSQIGEKFKEEYVERYPELEEGVVNYTTHLESEFETFSQALRQGLKQAHKMLKGREDNVLTGEEAFKLSASHGLSPELMRLNGIEFDEEAFEAERERHREVSRAGAEHKFGGHGLALDTGELKAEDAEEVKVVTRLHSATHLLNQALRDVLGEDVVQKGSDINVKRTRFDFSYPRKLTEEEKQQIESRVNQFIEEAHDLEVTEMPLAEAQQSGAIYLEHESYPDPVKIHQFGTVSKEFCGGPHVENTADIGTFQITKEEAVAQNVRRIRGVVR